MRPAFACLLALGLTQCAPPPAAPPAEPPVVAEEAVPDAAFCARPAEKQAFQVAALKSRLMVTALACDSSEKYNAFINANRTALLPQEKTLGGYFQRYYGRRAQTEHDECRNKAAAVLAAITMAEGLRPAGTLDARMTHH